MAIHVRRPRVFSALLGLALAACSSSSGPGEPAGVDATAALEPAGAAPAPATLAGAPAGLRAAHIAARQAEGLTQPAFHVIADARGLRTDRHLGLEARFDPTGVTLMTDRGLTGRLETSAVRCGTRELLRPVGAPAVVDPAAPHRVVRGATSGAAEWFVNGPLGLEHGFDLDPAGCAGSLTVELATPGFTPSLVGDNVRLASADGTLALRYGDLYAHDADGQPLPASFAVADHRVTIAVDVAAARGAITIDPLVYLERQRVGPSGEGGTGPAAGDGEGGDLFGYLIAISGDTALLGARHDDVGTAANQGSAYVYVRTGTTWALQQKLVASDGAADDDFAAALALDGDVAVIGSYRDDSLRGSAYVFVRSGAAWAQQQKLVGADSVAGDEYGAFVAVAGDTVLIGARGDDVGAQGDQGSVYVYVRSGATWTVQQKVTAGDGLAGDNFGQALDVDGDTAVIGAYLDDAPLANQGSAYVFVRSGTTWSQQQKVTAGDGAANDEFGAVVAISGETIIVGAYADDAPGADSGSAYVFTRTGTVWTQQQKLIASDGAANDSFGVLVDIHGDRALVGAYRDDSPLADRGSAYFFTRSGTTWTQQQLVAAGAAGDRFGLALALNGDTALIGADLADVGLNADQGKAYVYTFNGTTWTLAQQLDTGDGAQSDGFARTVAMSGDTALIGAYLDDVGTNVDQGSAYVFVRSGLTWALQQKLTAGDGAANDNFGISVALSGDTALIGSYFDDPSNQGSAYVFTRIGTTWTQEARLTASDAAADDNFGVSVAVDGDTALVGAFFDDGPGGTNQGSAYVFRRAGTVWALPEKLVAPPAEAGADRFGYSVALSGNTALIGAYLDDDPIGDQGSAWVFVWDGTSWGVQAQLLAPDAGSIGIAAHVGISVALSGDTALVGAYLANAPAIDQGAAYVFFRTGTTWAFQQRFTAGDGLANDQFGVSVALAGDLALVGSWLDDTGASNNRGSAYAFTRSGGVWTPRTKVDGSNGAANDNFGYSAVAVSGPGPAGYLAAFGALLADGLGPSGNVDEGAVYFGQLETVDVCLPPPAGITGWWPGDETTADLGGTNPAALLSGAGYGAGLVEEAFVLDGIDDHVLAAAGPADIYAFELWLKPTGTINKTSGAGGVQFFEGSATTYEALGFGPSTGPVTDEVITLFHDETAGYGRTAVTGITLQAGVWYHLAVSWNGSTYDIYVNAVKQVTTKGSAPSHAQLFTHANQVDIGRSFTTRFAGSIDELSIYNRTLTAAEVTAIFEAGSAGRCKAECAGEPDGTACTSDGNACTNDVCSANVCTHPAVAAGTVCRAGAGGCDVAETCDGTAAACPADGFVAGGTVCRGSAGACDVAEACTGAAAACPADQVATSDTVCRGAAGDCDVAESCTGSGVACPADTFEAAGTACGDDGDTVCDNPDTCNAGGACQPNPEPAATICRADAGDCDVAAERCDGAGACPADTFEAAGTACGSGADTDCDNADSCNADGACQVNHEPGTTECRADAGDCDVAERCDGAGGCPIDTFEAAGTACGSSDDTVCDNADSCNADGACQVNHEPGTTECRPDAGDCDVAERCDGAGGCPIDTFEAAGTACGSGADTDCDNADSCNADGACQVNHEPGTTECRADAGDCDVAERCDGAGGCPADTFEAAGTACGSGADTDCDNADSCNADGACQVNNEPGTTECRPDAGDCDVAERCDGAGGCPIDTFEAAGTACGSGADTDCDNADSCNADGACQVNNEPGTTECRPDAGDCDVAERCDGAGACPADTFEAAGTACGSGADTDCDNADSCNADGACQVNNEPGTTECRPDAGDCDVAERCDGAGACPADTFEAAGTACGSGADTDCDNADSCNADGACQVNHEPGTTECRPDAGDCDVAERCDGAGGCPIDTFEAAGTACGSGADTDCDNADSCNADGACQINNEPGTTECRPDAGDCDVAERCDGAGACPADTFEAAGTACGSGADTDCDNADSCNADGACQVNHEPGTTECRPDAGDCDVAERCDGAGACPADTFEAAGTACGSGADTDCDNADSCNADGACQVNHEPGTTECRPDAGDCDVAERCDGAGGCPIDTFEAAGTACGSGADTDCDNADSCNADGACQVNHEPGTTECRPDAGDCDVAERCDGAGGCPIDTFEAAGTACGSGADTDCDNADSCNADGACQLNNEPGTTECRPDAGDCDVAERCDGAGGCPIDTFEAAGTACGSGADTDCDNADSCNADGACQVNNEPGTTECRPAAGDCDVAERCDGAGACPIDRFEADGHLCGDGSASVCDNADTCNGDGACLANHQPETTICRDDAGDCDLAETCNAAGLCPDDAHESAGTACGDGADTVCDNPDSCNGTGTCNPNPEPATTTCRPGAGACDLAEVCDGAGACPNDAFAMAGTACDPAGETCMVSAEVCTGAAASCPADDTTACNPHVVFVSTPSPTIVGKCNKPSHLRPVLRPIAVNQFGFPLPVTCTPISGVGVHDDVVCTATDLHGHTASVTITVTVLARLRVAFQSPLEDDNQRNNVHTDDDVVNKFKAGVTVNHKVKLYACNGNDVTQALAASVTVKLHVTERNQITDHLVVDVPENYSGVGGPGGLMVPHAGAFQYNLKTNGYEEGTTNNVRYFRSLVKVQYNTHPTITAGREDARLESKP